MQQCASRLRIFFFFQAEDGIRDLTVTGVQTCALPISPCAYLWDAARRKGLWVVNFGERSETDSGPGGSTHTKLSGLDSITVPSYPAFRLEIRDTTRARLFADSVASWDRQGRFPDLVFLWLARGHTYARARGQPTPRSMV